MPTSPPPADGPGGARSPARAPGVRSDPAPNIPLSPRSEGRRAPGRDRQSCAQAARPRPYRTRPAEQARAQRREQSPRIRKAQARPSSPSRRPAIGLRVANRISMHRVPRILKDLQLVLEPCHLLRLLRLLERVGVLVARLAQLSDLAVGIAEMLGDGGIAAGEIDGPFELLDRLLVFTLLVVHPTETVDIEAVLGLNIQRPLD